MGFRSILGAIEKGLSIFGVLSPSLIPQTPTVVRVESELTKVAQLVGTAQAVGAQVQQQLTATPSTGGTAIDINLAKAQALLPTVKMILAEANFISGKKIADETKFTAGAQKILDGIVDVLNSVEHKE